MRTKKEIVAAVVVTVCLMVIVLIGVFQDFDAQGYVRAILDQRFQGKTEEAQKIIEGSTEEELTLQYEEGIKTFVEHYISSGVEMNPELEQKFVDLCKEIFLSMKYQVNEAEKVNRKEYDVDVEFQPSDVFIRFVEAIRVESESMKQKAENGEYQGTKDEISMKMQEEFLNRSYELLSEAYQNMEYRDTETMVFKVINNDKNKFSLKEEEISSFITKILCLDEIQG